MSNLTANVGVLAKGDSSNKALLIAVLLQTGLWDSLPPADREAWCERAEILDTPGGRLLLQLVDNAGAFQ